MTDNAPVATGSSLPETAGRPEHAPDGKQRIVVGFDGPSASLPALLFAAKEAQVREASSTWSLRTTSAR